MKIYANYHTHTFRCGHASGDVVDYARVASGHGARILGISDHVPHHEGEKWWDSTRMKKADIPDYERAIDEARKAFPGMLILKAFECEYFSELHSYYRDELLGERGCDYLINGTHCLLVEDEWVGVGLTNTPDLLKNYRDKVVESIESGLFAFIAHPDMFAAGYRVWDKHAEDCANAICKAAENTGTPIEINGYGWRKKLVDTPSGKRAQYPLPEFWDVASEYDLEVVCSSDAHRPEDVMSGIADGMRMAEKLGLKLADMEARLGLKAPELVSQHGIKIS